MAYVMTLAEGEDFYVDDIRFVLTAIEGPQAVQLLRDSDKDVFVMRDDGQTHAIAPLTSAYVGTRGTATHAKIAVDAPKSVAIDPGTSYRAKGGHTRRSG